MTHIKPALQAQFESLKASGLLPAPKGVALSILKLTQQDDSSSTDLARAIGADPALVARLIKLANNCLLSGARPALAIKDAIQTLGLNAVRGLVLASSLMADRQAASCVCFDYGTFWSRSLAVAVAMRAFAARTRVIQSDEAFTLGLLANMGEPSLAALYPQEYARLLASAQPETLLRLEQQAFGFDHAELSAALLLDWGFPAGLVDAVALPEPPDTAPEAGRSAQLAALLRLACSMAGLCMAEAASRPARMRPLLAQAEQLDIAGDDLLSVCDDIVQDWSDWSTLLELAARKLPPFAELLKSAPAATGPAPAATDAAALAAPPDSTQLHQFADEFARLTRRLEESQQKNLENERRMELALAGSELGSWDWNVISGAMVFNERWCSMLGYRARELPPHVDSWRALVHPQDRAHTEATLQQHLASGHSIYESEHRLRHKDGHWVWVLDRGRVVGRNAQGAPLRVVGTQMDITARKQTEAELLRSNRELEQFSYSISHDMRQPLRMIHSYLQLLQKSLGSALTPQQAMYFKFASEGAHRIDAMMLGLLEYSRVGRKGEPRVWVQSRALIDEALHFLHASMADASVRLQGQWPQVLVSRDELVRLLQNLLGNALKFRQPGQAAQITVTSALADQHWQLCVADNGIGIEPAQIEQLFQVFSRLQSRLAYEGTGIGLALCRRIAEHHGGRIWAESSGALQGSRLCFELPQPAPDGAAAPTGTAA